MVVYSRLMNNLQMIGGCWLTRVMMIFTHQAPACMQIYFIIIIIAGFIFYVKATLHFTFFFLKRQNNARKLKKKKNTLIANDRSNVKKNDLFHAWTRNTGNYMITIILYTCVRTLLPFCILLLSLKFSQNLTFQPYIVSR